MHIYIHTCIQEVWPNLLHSFASAFTTYAHAYTHIHKHIESMVKPTPFSHKRLLSAYKPTPFFRKRLLSVLTRSSKIKRWPFWNLIRCLTFRPIHMNCHSNEVPHRYCVYVYVCIYVCIYIHAYATSA